ELSRQGAGQAFGDLVLDGRVAERRDRDRVDALRKQIRLSGEVISTGSQRQACPQRQEETDSGSHNNWRATITAFDALSRRLSATAQIQQACGWFRSSATPPTEMPSS